MKLKPFYSTTAGASVQEEALELSAAAQELCSKKLHPLWVSLRQEHCTAALTMGNATSMARGETWSSKASIPQQGCPLAGQQEICHLLSARGYCTCWLPFTGYACASSSFQPKGLKGLCSGERTDQTAQHWRNQANPDAYPADSRFLKMPESCNANWRLKVILAWFCFT